jgi:hypothetical protein
MRTTRCRCGWTTTRPVVNGDAYALDVPPQLLFSKTFVPLRFVAEFTDCQVDYLGTAVQVTDIDGSVLMVYLQ